MVGKTVAYQESPGTAAASASAAAAHLQPVPFSKVTKNTPGRTVQAEVNTSAHKFREDTRETGIIPSSM